MLGSSGSDSGRRRLTKRTLGILIIGGATAVHTHLAARLVTTYRPLDGPLGAVLASTLEEDTTFAAGFSDDAFSRVRKGMSALEARSAVGVEPLSVSRYPDGLQVWRFSESPGGTHYRMRMVFLRGGRVEALRAGFYVD